MHSRVLLPYVNKLYKHGFSFSFIFTKDECNSLENLTHRVTQDSIYLNIEGI